MTIAHADVAITRQIIKLIEDRVWCWHTDEHDVCLIAPTAASWPIPNPLNDLDDPDWVAL